jgi:dynein heavy chain, axonemal
MWISDCGTLQGMPAFVDKILQLQSCRTARHGNMLVGRTGSGKTLAWRTLQRALERLKAQEPHKGEYQKVNTSWIRFTSNGNG